MMSARLRSVLTTGGLVLAAAAAAVTSSLKADEKHDPPPKPSRGEYTAPQQAYCPPSYCPPEEKKPWRWSSRWYAEEAMTPTGAPQKEKHGKLWPPFPRRTGKEQQFWHRFHSAHYWPYPYVCDDRAYVRDVSAQQIESGWVTATTLYDYHFDEETHEVNSAGRLHLRWIVESVPVSRRMVYVQSTLAPDTSEARLASVREDLVMMVGPDAPPPVMLRIAPLYGRPAVEIDLIRRAERDNLPVPHIQYEPNPTSGSSGSGSGM